MATLTKEQIEAKQRRYVQLVDEAAKLREELAAAGVQPLEEDELDKATGGFLIPRLRAEFL